jgi:hypothetical protein
VQKPTKSAGIRQEAMVKNYFKTRSSGSHETRTVKQVLKPDLLLPADIMLEPRTEPFMLVLPDYLPAQEVQNFQIFLRKVDGVKIGIVGGSSDKGYNIGIQVLKPLNLSEVLSDSNMLPVNRTDKKGDRIILAPNNMSGGIKNST